MVTAWTRDDLPSADDIPAMVSDRIFGVIPTLDAVVAHLNREHPKPGRDFAGVDWRAQYEQAEGRRDHWQVRYEQAERERDEAHVLANRRMGEVHATQVERDEALEASALFQRDVHKWRSEWVAVSEDLKAARRQSDLAHDQWKKWEYKAGQRDELLIQAEAERDEWKARAEAAEARTDPVEEKARELYRVATPDARWETVADEYRRIAAHVLEQETER